MPPKLTQLIRDLKNEKCPQRVRDQVRGRISAGESLPSRLRLAVPMALAGVVLLAGLLLWQRQVRQQAQSAQLTLERTRVARQAENALGLVGSMLLTAGNDSEKIISDRTLPPLHDSFESARNKLNQYINL